MLRTLEQPLGSSYQNQKKQYYHQKESQIFLTRQGESTASIDDIQNCKTLITKLINNQSESEKKLSQLADLVQNQQFQGGIGYYNAKNSIFMEYLIHLQFYQLFKINAVDLTQGVGLNLYQRLIYLKTLLLKLQPVEKKLQYQKNKMLKYSETVIVEASKQKEDQDVIQSDQEQQQNNQIPNINQEEDQDLLSFQPRVQQLMKVKNIKEKNQTVEDKYVAPKISSNLSKDQKLKKKLELQKERKKAFLIRKYRDDLIEGDQAREEQVQDGVSQKIKRKFQQKTAMEEQNFVRLPETKKQKFWRKSLMRNQFKKSVLEDQLDDIKMIKQIFDEQKQQNIEIRQKKRHAPKEKKFKKIKK